MDATPTVGHLAKITRSDEPVFFLKRVWVHEYWHHLERDPDIPKRDSPDEWCAAVDRGEMFVLGARIVFLESVGV